VIQAQHIRELQISKLWDCGSQEILKRDKQPMRLSLMKQELQAKDTIFRWLAPLCSVLRKLSFGSKPSSVGNS